MNKDYSNVDIFEPTHRDGENLFSWDWGVAIFIGLFALAFTTLYMDLAQTCNSNDVNGDGLVNITDLSVLATRINNQ